MHVYSHLGGRIQKWLNPPSPLLDIKKKNRKNLKLPPSSEKNLKLSDSPPPLGV